MSSLGIVDRGNAEDDETARYDLNAGQGLVALPVYRHDRFPEGGDVIGDVNLLAVPHRLPAVPPETDQAAAVGQMKVDAEGLGAGMLRVVGNDRFEVGAELFPGLLGLGIFLIVDVAGQGDLVGGDYLRAAGKKRRLIQGLSGDAVNGVVDFPDFFIRGNFQGLLHGRLGLLHLMVDSDRDQPTDQKSAYDAEKNEKKDSGRGDFGSDIHNYPSLVLAVFSAYSRNSLRNFTSLPTKKGQL